MRITRIAGRGVALTAAAALALLGATAASASGPAAHGLAGAPGAAGPGVGTVPGAQLWAQRYTSHPRNPARNGADAAEAVAVSPDGRTVFVTGARHAWDGFPSSDYATIAYNANTGARKWVQRYNGPGNSGDEAWAIAVSPREDTVFVTGGSVGATSEYDYATIAYDAATGARKWTQRYNGPGNYFDEARAIAVSPTGNTVFVTGESEGTTLGENYATIAYDAATGARQWTQRYGGAGNNADAHSVAVSPGGGTVFVTGSGASATGGDYVTIAYDAGTGAQLWVQRYAGLGDGADASSVAVSPGGDAVLVTGHIYRPPSSADYATIAYDAATGAQLWVQRYGGPGNNAYAHSVAISPGGDTVFVTGTSAGATTGEDYATVAYNAATGARQWIQRYNSGADDEAWAITASPAGGTVYVTGFSYQTSTGDDYATLAYNAATGARQWIQRYNGPANGTDDAQAIAVSPTGSTVFVTGYSYDGGGTTSDSDYATIAYRG